MPRRKCVYPTSILCLCRFLRLEAGVPGDLGVTALGAAGVVSSSHPGTARGPSPGMVANTARAAGPASAPATLRTARLAQVRGGTGSGRQEGLSFECWTKVLTASAAGEVCPWKSVRERDAMLAEVLRGKVGGCVG